MKKIIFPVIVALALFGAGCAPTIQTPAASTATPATSAVQSSTASAPAPSPAKTTQESNQAASTSSTSNSSSTTMTNTTHLAFPGILPASETEGKYVHIKTNKGDIVFQLLPKEGPNAVSNFVYLAKKKFYDGLTFHRVVPDFVIQGGDPKGDGTGGPGYEFKNDPVHLPYNEGIVAMANAGPNTNGSQFFIMLKDTPLPPSYSIFGRVVSGMDVVHKIQVGDTMTLVTVEDHQ